MFYGLSEGVLAREHSTMTFDVDGMSVLFLLGLCSTVVVDGNVVAELSVDIFETTLASFRKEEIDDGNVDCRRDEKHCSDWSAKHCTCGNPCRPLTKEELPANNIQRNRTGDE